MTPYITPAELTTLPLGIDWSTIAGQRGNATLQAAIQTQLCWNATNRIDDLANQVLRATVDTETLSGPDFRVTMEGNGLTRALLARWPVLSVTGVQVAPSNSFPRQWTVVPSTDFDVESPITGIPGAGPDAAGAGPSSIVIAPGYVSWWAGRNGYRVQVSYLNGWPNSGFDQPVLVGATSAHTDDITAWTGLSGMVYDGANTETLTVSSVTPDTSGATSGPGTLTFASATLFAHDGSIATPIRFSAMPASLQWAAACLCAAQALTRGATALAVQTAHGAQSSHSSEDLVIEAETIVARFARVI